MKWEFYDLDFSVSKSRRYHERLSAFYAAWRDRLKYATAITGCSAFVLLFAEGRLGTWLSAGVAFWSILDLIARPDLKAEKHRVLCNKFLELKRDLETAPRTRAALQELKARRVEIEKEDDPCKRLVDLMARNDECRAQNYPSSSLVPLSWHQEFFGYWITYGMRRLNRWRDQNAGPTSARRQT
jgi:hypothetical protein